MYGNHKARARKITKLSQKLQSKNYKANTYTSWHLTPTLKEAPSVIVCRHVDELWRENDSMREAKQAETTSSWIVSLISIWHVLKLLLMKQIEKAGSITSPVIKSATAIPRKKNIVGVFKGRFLLFQSVAKRPTFAKTVTIASTPRKTPEARRTVRKSDHGRLVVLLEPSSFIFLFKTVQFVSGYCQAVILTTPC